MKNIVHWNNRLEKVLMNVDKIICEGICKRLKASIKSPQSELTYSSDYTFLIAVILSAQSTDVQVNKVTVRLFSQYSTIDAILSLGREGLEREICSIGLFRNKANNIIEMSKIIKEKFNSQVPADRLNLESLPGVGRKTANVVLNTLFHQHTIAVDTHVLRLSNRLKLSDSNTPLKVEQDLESSIPEEYKKDISNLLVLHGRYICKAKKTDCANCVLSDLCDFYKTNNPKYELK